MPSETVAFHGAGFLLGDHAESLAVINAELPRAIGVRA